MKVKESEEQAALFDWADYKPELEWMFAIPNGGSRNPIEAKNLKRQGVRAGVSDIALLLARGKYHALLIELKVGKNIPTKEQVKFLLHHNINGYCGVICYGAEEAIEVICKYLKGNDLSDSVKRLEKWAVKYGLMKEWKDLLSCMQKKVKK